MWEDRVMDGITLDYKLAALLKAQAELDGLVALKAAGNIKPYISKLEAGKIYGRTQVQKWLDDQVVTPRQDEPGKRMRLDRVELASVAASQSLIQYIATNT